MQGLDLAVVEAHLTSASRRRKIPRVSPGVVLAALLYVNAVLFVAATFAPAVPRLAIPAWLSTGALFPALVALLLANLFLHRRRLAASPRGLLTFFAVLSLLALTRLPHLLYPLAPPRMMTGFVDTMREFGPNIYPKNAIDGAANQIAAMPSLHFGWAMIESIAVITILKSRWRWLIVLHPFLMAMSIIATGNHWWIDAAAAAVIIVGAVALYRMLKLWAGDRHWSWTAMRFKTDEGLARLEELANSRSDDASDDASDDDVSDEGNTLERVD